MSNNTLSSMNETINIPDQVAISSGDPSFILPSLMAMIAGLTFLVLLFFNKKINSWVFQRLYPIKYSLTPYDKIEIDGIKEIISKLNHNYRILITIFGILLAFVISDKISFALFNWNFVIWVGWILGVILKSAWNMLELSDIVETEKSIEHIRFVTYKNKQFIKHSIVILIFGIAFLPSFMFLESPSEKKLNDLPWDRPISILAGAIGILGATAGFFWILGLAPFDIKHNFRLMYFTVLLLFIFGSISTWSTLSPIEPKLVTFGGDITFYIPQVIVTIISFGAGTSGIVLFMFLEMLDYRRDKRKNQSKNIQKFKIKKSFDKISQEIKNKLKIIRKSSFTKFKNRLTGNSQK